MFMLFGILADPGVPEKTYLYYSKMYIQGDGELTSSDEDASASTQSQETQKDDENPNALVQNRKYKK